MAQPFDPGPVSEPFRSLAEDFPGADVYPPADFRVEWGPVFHRGRLDGSARVLVIGQDPAQHEAIARRAMVGEAGQRVQAFLAKLGIERSYLIVNAFLYSVYGQGRGEAHRDDPGIVEYRHRWLDAIVDASRIEAVIAFGGLADDAFTRWRATPGAKRFRGAYAHAMHPTAPEGVAAGDPKRLRAMMRQLLANWNRALAELHPKVRTPDVARELVPYNVRGWATNAPIPAFDLPAGSPPWMRSTRLWADRKGRTVEDRRATIVVTVPEGERPWRRSRGADA
jgi:uracil-DNA glycosylase